MQDGQYIDADTKELYVTLPTYNTIRTAFGYTEFTFTWQHSGDIQVAVHIATMPTVPYISPRDRSAAHLLVRSLLKTNIRHRFIQF